MDPRHYVNILKWDDTQRREEAWREMHRRPDALPLPPEDARPLTERVTVLRWLSRAADAARRVPRGARRGGRSERAEPRLSSR